ncbi:hypothetical protein MAUB_51770 [Mycolicibacterium aubagnense]|uniref:Uncharacterized protein n=1 Tax=Mycolicibacterium aubagnense TaxID=319707 RepID=A0ABM7IKJ3_9MYCO|nr:hypothetical protein MAUB_51770 [Mycolicibacterium aubagnense]
MLGVGGLRGSQLLVQIQLRGVHGLSGLFRLARQLVELCYGVVRRIGQDVAREYTAEYGEPRDRTGYWSFKTAYGAVCAVKTQDFASFNCGFEPLRTQ